MTTPEEPRPWKRFASENGTDLLLFRPRWDLMENPRTGEQMQRLVLETRDWVNVVAFTPERRIVMVKQYRFGSARVTTEIPGGVVDPGEDPEVAASRELREETGYASKRWSYLGAVEPNPAFHDNLCHHYLCEDAELVHERELDSGEDIVVTTWSIQEARTAFASGELNHSLVISALTHVIDFRPD